MSGVRITVTAHGLDDAMRRLSRLGIEDRGVLLDTIGAVVENQTKRRISSEKRSPDGAAWKPNIEGTSILERQGYLLGSIHRAVSGDSVRVGSGLVYAAIHQFGGTILPKTARRLAFTLNGGQVFARKATIPARPYLGVNAQNAEEVERAIAVYLRKKLG